MKNEKEKSLVANPLRKQQKDENEKDSRVNWSLGVLHSAAFSVTP